MAPLFRILLIRNTVKKLGIQIISKIIFWDKERNYILSFYVLFAQVGACRFWHVPTCLDYFDVDQYDIYSSSQIIIAGCPLFLSTIIATIYSHIVDTGNVKIGLLKNKILAQFNKACIEMNIKNSLREPRSPGSTGGIIR